MLTKWGKRLLAACTFGNERAVIPVVIGTGVQCYAATFVDNDNIDHYGISTTAFNANAPSNATEGFMLGSGDAPESEDSYWLESQYQGTTGLTVSCTISSSYDEERNVATHTRLITVTNTSTEPKRIAELGTRARIRTRPNANELASNTNTNNALLIDRTVLDTPIDIPPNGSATIEYVLSIDLSE